jgi:hypothetical protein
MKADTNDQLNLLLENLTENGVCLIFLSDYTIITRIQCLDQVLC